MSTLCTPDPLVPAALDALPSGAEEPLDRHLRRCPPCRAELDRLREATALLALAAPQVAPPPLRLARLLTRAIRQGAPRPAATA